MSVADLIRVTHAGSLPRPPELNAALREERRSGAPRSDAVRAQAAAATHDVVARQIDAGIDVVGDGEQGRVGFQIYIPQRIRGFAGAHQRNAPSELRDFPLFAATWMERLQGGEGMVGPPCAVAPLEYVGAQDVQDDCAALHAAIASSRAPDTPGFVTAPSPGMITTTFGNQHYDAYEEFLAAAANELRKEYRIIVDAGFVLQIDSPDLAMERTMHFADTPLREFLAAAELHVDALNRALAGIAPDRVRLHCCWGNHESPHTHDVELADILPVVLQARVGAIGFAFSNPRHQHELAVIADHGLPDSMALVAGVVDTTTNYVEHPQVVAERVASAVRAVGDPSRVLVSPDCGFATFADYHIVSPDVAWAKLEALAAGCELATRAL
jgi:5-methyltetrahydropteroyltriglutamate--homocysteine methyltransferase